MSIGNYKVSSKYRVFGIIFRIIATVIWLQDLSKRKIVFIMEIPMKENLFSIKRRSIS